MSTRKYLVELMRHEENFSGLRGDFPAKMLGMVALDPTAENVRALIADKLPGAEIDDRWLTVDEQIDNDGMTDIWFSIGVKMPENHHEFETYTVTFDCI